MLVDERGAILSHKLLFVVNLFADELFQDFNPLHAETSQLFPL